MKLQDILMYYILFIIAKFPPNEKKAPRINGMPVQNDSPY